MVQTRDSRSAGRGAHAARLSPAPFALACSWAAECPDMPLARVAALPDAYPVRLRCQRGMLAIVELEAAQELLAQQLAEAAPADAATDRVAALQLLQHVFSQTAVLSSAAVDMHVVAAAMQAAYRELHPDTAERRPLQPAAAAKLMQTWSAAGWCSIQRPSGGSRSSSITPTMRTAAREDHAALSAAAAHSAIYQRMGSILTWRLPGTSELGKQVDAGVEAIVQSVKVCVEVRPLPLTTHSAHAACTALTPTLQRTRNHEKAMTSICNQTFPSCALPPRVMLHAAVHCGAVQQFAVADGSQWVRLPPRM